jgi:hypothetical protein
MSVPLPTTTLDAVNIILAGIGEAPVSSLVSDNQDVTNATRKLDEAQREITGRGLWFNTECFTVTPVAGEYSLAPNVYTAKPVRWDKRQFVQRGRRLYDLANNRYDGNTDDIDVEMIIGLEYEDLPEEARQAILYQAVRKFSDSIIGSVQLHQITAQDELAARAALMSRHLEEVRYNSFDAPTPLRTVARWR